MSTPQPPHGPGHPVQQPPQQTPLQGPPQTSPHTSPQGPPPHSAPTQQFQTAPGGPGGFGGAGGPGGPGAQWQPAGPPPRAAKPPVPRVISAIWVLGLISVIATVIGLSVKENGFTAWHSVHAWGGVAILGALLTLAPAIAGPLNLAPHRAWQVATCGAGGLLLFWVLFVLPAVGSNTSLLVTIGAAAGIVGAWIAPGRETAAGHETPPGREPVAGQRPDQHTW